MTEVWQGPTPRVRFREVSALTRCPLRGTWLYLHVRSVDVFVCGHFFSWLYEPKLVSAYVTTYFVFIGQPTKSDRMQSSRVPLLPIRFQDAGSRFCCHGNPSYLWPVRTVSVGPGCLWQSWRQGGYPDRTMHCSSSWIQLTNRNISGQLLISKCCYRR